MQLCTVGERRSHKPSQPLLATAGAKHGLEPQQDLGSLPQALPPSLGASWEPFFSSSLLSVVPIAEVLPTYNWKRELCLCALPAQR